MGMHIIRLADARPFDPPGHRGVRPVRLQGGDVAPDAGIGVAQSYDLPSGEAAMAHQPLERVHVTVAGELTMISEGRESTLRPLDSVRFTAGTVRGEANRMHLPAGAPVIRRADRAAAPAAPGERS